MTDQPFDPDLIPGPMSHRAQEQLFGTAALRGRIFKDGDAWCCTGPGFQDPVVSAFGCGPTPEAAYESWRRDGPRRPEWKGRDLPRFEDFKIEH